MAAQTLRLGFLLNPYAGLGGPLGLKGSDKLNAEHKTAPSRARERAKRTLQPLLARAGQLQLSSAPGPMGSDLLKQLGLPHRVLGKLGPGACHAEDSERLAAELAASGIDLLVFVGGDGTARNIVNGLGETFARQACLGIPAGVKMHSAVFAINPEAATGVIELLLDSGLVDIASQEVRDIDEDKFRQGVVRSKYYGELQVPALGQFVQTTKNSGREVEELVLADIGAYIVERLEDDFYYFIGPGSTPKCVLDELGIEGTLLGFDVLQGQQLIARDVSAEYLERLCQQQPGHCIAIITPIAGQGHLIGRGNQQLSPAVLKATGRQNLWVVASKTKITELKQRPLLVDSNDPDLDRQLSGFIQVITGYQDQIYYPISGGA